MKSLDVAQLIKMFALGHFTLNRPYATADLQGNCIPVKLITETSIQSTKALLQ
jgi:hypothetical protein